MTERTVPMEMMPVRNILERTRAYVREAPLEQVLIERVKADGPAFRVTAEMHQ